MNAALRLRPVARRTTVIAQSTAWRPKSTLVKDNHVPHQEPNYTKTYGMVLLGGCAIAAVLDRMGISHHDLMPSSTTKMSRRDTLLDGVRGTNWR